MANLNGDYYQTWYSTRCRVEDVLSAQMSAPVSDLIWNTVAHYTWEQIGDQVRACKQTLQFEVIG